MFLKSNFFDIYYINSPPLNCFKNTYQIYSSEIYFFNCFFKEIQNPSSSGGAISIISSLICHFYLLECFFMNCSARGNLDYGGGSVLYQCINGASALNKVCGSNSYTITDSRGQFALLYVKTTEINQINQTSTNYCCPQKMNQGRNSLRLEYGKQLIIFYNSSYNYPTTLSSFVFFSSTSSNGKFLNSYKSNVTDYGSILIQFNSAYIENSNIIECNSPNFGIVTVYDNAKLIFSNSIFLNNFNTLFFIHTGSMTVNYSWIFHPNFLYGSNIIHLNKMNIYNFTLYYKFNYFCNEKNTSITNKNFKIFKIMIISILLLIF